MAQSRDDVTQQEPDVNLLGGPDDPTVPEPEEGASPTDESREEAFVEAGAPADVPVDETVEAVNEAGDAGSLEAEPSDESEEASEAPIESLAAPEGAGESDAEDPTIAETEEADETEAEVESAAGPASFEAASEIEAAEAPEPAEDEAEPEDETELAAAEEEAFDEVDNADGVNGSDGEIEPVEILDREQTLQAIHALLFASDRPLSADRIAEALGDIDRDVVRTLVEEVRAHVAALDVPYVLREIAGGYQLTTKPHFGPYIRRLFQIKKSNRLSKSVLETLAIIAYKQPVTRPDVEAIRGVSVSHAFEILQERKLIKVAGVAELPGRPKLYRTTDEFLMHFGLESLKELPSIEEIREMGY
jgi:segregation and condensation protein B